MFSPVLRTDFSPKYPQPTLDALYEWALRSTAEDDLEITFGSSLHWPTAFRLLHAFRTRDFSVLPPVTSLDPCEMPGLLGGYSRDLNRIFLAADCPAEDRTAVLLEEIGHFLDHALCSEETPGDEGAVFASRVLGSIPAPWVAEDRLWPLRHEGATVLVEAARKLRGSLKNASKSGGKARGLNRKGKNGKGKAAVAAPGTIVSQSGNIVYAFEPAVRIVQTTPGQRLIGSRGDDTFVVISDDVDIQDPHRSTDTIESTISFSLAKHFPVENLALAGAAHINGTGNTKANLITGNSGNNRLDGGNDSQVDTLAGGAGNDTYVLNDTLDVIVELPGGGSDTIETTINAPSLADFQAENVENLTFNGIGSATLAGNALANILTGGNEADTLYGAAGDTLVGRQGDDLYYVQSSTAVIVEGEGPLDGNDTVSTALSTYSIAPFENVEELEYTGARDSSLTGNSGNNVIYGSLLPRNTINGGAGDDYIYGGDTTDSLVGGDGNDTLAVTRWSDSPLGALGVALRVNRGTDTLNGGAGDDWFVVDSQTAYSYQDTQGTNTVASTVDFSLKYNRNISDNIKNLYLIGADSLRGTGSDSANTITGNDGDNFIAAGGGGDSVHGGLGADFINGETGNDTLIGGGQPQTDLPDDASTPVEIRSGQEFIGRFDFRRDEDWVKVVFNEGETYKITLTATLSGNDIFKNNSWITLGDPVDKDGDFAYGVFNPLSSLSDYWWGDWWSYNYDGYDGGIFKVEYDFTAFDSGEFYLPVRVGGPSTGAYTLNVEGSDVQPSYKEVLADDGQNTVLGGIGNDFLVSGNGRDSLGAAIGDILHGGTNGIPGGIDLDTVSGGNRDTLIGGDGGDLLDGGRGIDSMAGGQGNDTYYIDERLEKVVEEDNGGQDDLGIFSYAPGRVFSDDLRNGLFTSLTNLALSSLTGAGFDVDLSNGFRNVEHASLMGSANLYVLGNNDPNSLFGNFGDNLLVGALGNDSLFGEVGKDYLVGGDGGDLLDGGAGQNTMDGGLGDDTYVVNDRDDRVINEIAGLDGGVDLVRTFFNFDPMQGSVLEQFQPDQPDNSPSANKSPSFASKDLQSFYNIENFKLLGQAAYGVGNALGNQIRTAEGYAGLLLGMGGDDSLFGIDNSDGLGGNDSLFGDTPDFYASPDLYAPAPSDTRTKEFLDSVVGAYGNDYLDGAAGDDYLDGGRGIDTMIGGRGDDTFVQDNVDDFIVASGGGANELISSVNIAKAPDGISKLMLVVAEQEPGSGQAEVAKIASFNGTAGGNNRTEAVTTGNITLTISEANILELMYAPRPGEVFAKEGDSTPSGSSNLNVGLKMPDLNNPGKFQFDLSWTAGPNAATDVVGYTVEYRKRGGDDIWLTYVKGKSQDFQGSQTNPTLTVTNLEDAKYDFRVTAHQRTIPALRDRSAAQHVTLQGGAGNDAVIGLRLTRILPGGLADDELTDPLVQNNPNFGLPLGFIFNPAPYNNRVGMPNRFATYLDGGFGNDLINGDFVNDRSGDDYIFQGVTFKGLNTLVGGQGSDTFVVKNGGTAIGDEFDWVVKFGNETPISTQPGNVGSSLNGGQHNLVVSRVPFLVLSDTLVHQGKFIDQLALAGGGQFGMGNRLDNYIYDAGIGLNTLAGGTGRDSIVGNASDDLLIGGTAYGKDDVWFAVRDFASVIDGGNGLLNSIFRDTDPIPVNPSGPGVADPSQFWFVPGFYGGVYDPNRNQDTLIANAFSTLDGGAGKDSMVGSDSANQVAPGFGDMFFVSQGQGGSRSQSIGVEDAVYGNNGNDTVMFTDSDYLWWSGHLEGSLLAKNGYTIANDISNLILQAGSPSARNATGNDNSEGNYGQGSNIIQGNEFDNEIDGAGVGGPTGTGTGVDVLIGGSGSDNFIVSGYTNSETNEWKPEIEEISEGEDAGYSIWKGYDLSVYIDADYAVIRDFEAGDNLELPPNVEYWIGDAPEGDNIPPSFNKKVPLLGYLESPNPTTRFGIYNASGTPNLVAVVNLVGGLELDLLSLQLAFDPVPPDGEGRFKALTGSPAVGRLGWGTFWKLEGSNFAQYVNQAYIAEDSFASLTTLVRSDDDTFIGGALADSYNGYGGNDSLLGGANNDTLLGDSGNDELFGEAGNDSLLGGIGADYLDGGIGNDQMIGGAGDDTYIVDSLLDNVVELPDAVGLPRQGTDVVEASVSGYTLAANVEYLFLTGSAVDGYGNSLNNRVFGNALDNTLGGGDGNDTMDGGDGTDTLQGGDGDDLYIVDSTTDTIEDTNGTDTVVASVSFDLSDSNVNGGTGIEHLTYTGLASASLTGNNLANSLIGGAGSDTLDGKELDDTLIGGAGDDFYIYTSAAASGSDRIEDVAGTDTILTATHFDLAASLLNTSVIGLAVIENLQLTITTGASLLGNAQNNLITGNLGNDTLEGRASNSSGDTLNGGSGNDLYIVDSTTDLIIDSSGSDMILSSVSFDLSNTLVGGGTAIEHLTFTLATGSTLTGNAAANSIRGGSGTGADLMIGGKGNDTYFVGENDVVQEESLNGGVDWVIASADFILGDFIENLVLDGNNPINGTGNSGANTIYGNSAANSIDGGAGIDSLVGGSGNDTYFIDDIGDIISELSSGGVDTVVSKFNGYGLGDNLEHLILASGVAGVIAGLGNDVDNSLTGNSFSNNLFGGAGNDTLTGSRTRGSGEIDTLRGGAGADVFVLGDVSNVFYSAAAGEDYALIQDFTITQDRILISGPVANYTINEIGGDGYQDITLTSSSELIAKVKTTSGILDGTMFQTA